MFSASSTKNSAGAADLLLGELRLLHRSSSSHLRIATGGILYFRLPTFFGTTSSVLALFFVLTRRWGLGRVETQLFILGIALPTTVTVSQLFFVMFERPFLNRSRSPPSIAPGPTVAAVPN